MLDKMIGFGATFDWITPVVTFIQDYLNRPSVGYNIPVDAGWSAYAVRDLLTAHGIKIWGLTIFGNIITLRVRKAQARFAQYLMEQEAIPYQGGVRGDVGASRTAGTGTQKKSSGDWMDDQLDGLARLFGAWR